MVRAERQEEHHDHQENTELDPVLPFVVLAARAAIGLDDFVCDADVTSGDDHANEPEVPVQVDDDPFVEFQSWLLFQVHTGLDLCQINYGLVAQNNVGKRRATKDHHPDGGREHFAKGQIVSERQAARHHDLKESVQTYQPQQGDAGVLRAVEKRADVAGQNQDCSEVLAQLGDSVEGHDQGHEHVGRDDVFQVHHEGGGGFQVQGDPGRHAVEQQRHGEHHEVENGDDVLVVNESSALKGSIRCLVGG